jgi:SPP1 gp7 family putative phage head morphogenesis protein
MRLLPIRVTNYINRLTADPKATALEEIKRELTKDKGHRLSINLTHYRTYKAEMQQDELRKAILMAEDPIRPDRTLLLAIYKEALRDPHLLSQFRTNILKVIGSPFAIFKEGTDEIDEDATRLFQTPWFNRFRYIYHETRGFGHTLVEFQQMMPPLRPNGLELEFKSVKVFPREHVRPETGEIILDSSIEKGIPYRDEPWNEWLLEIGDPHDLGLLNIAAREVIWKNYSRTDWSRRSEKFGLPIIVIKTASRKKEELDKVEKMASEFGSNLYMILDDEDNFEIKESTKGDGHVIFKDMADFCDAQNSKLISGQTGTSDEKAFVGSAAVHENILNEYMEESMRNETYYNNEELFPFLIRHGYPLEGLEFRYLAFMKDQEEAVTDPSTDPPTPTKIVDPKKQKATANFTKPLPKAIGKGLGTLTSRISSLYHAECCHEHASNLQGFLHRSPYGQNLGGLNPVAVDLDDAVNRALQRVYDKKLKAGGVDKDVFMGWASDLWKSTNSGYGVNLDALKYASPDHVLLNQLRYNIHVFAVFKNHHHTNELVKALVTDDGKVRSFGEFKKAAGMVNDKYNKNWLKTEHNQAILSGRNAQRWTQIQSRKHIFPNVEYVAVNDDRISQICKDLDGAIWSADDPVLATLAPSNHWGCRSFLRSSNKDLNPKATGEDLQPAFKNNAGISGDAFGKEHPYYEVQDIWKEATGGLFGAKNQMPISPEDLHRNIQLYQALDKKLYSSINTYPESGGWYAIHKKTDKTGLKENAQIAKLLAEDGNAIIVVEHVLTNRISNPELIINGIKSDLKSPTKINGISNGFEKASKQLINNAVIDIPSDWNIDEIVDKIAKGFLFNNEADSHRVAIEFVRVRYQDRFVSISRQDYNEGIGKIKSLLKK